MLSSEPLLKRNEGGSSTLFSACFQMHKEGTHHGHLARALNSLTRPSSASGILHVADVKKREGPEREISEHLRWEWLQDLDALGKLMTKASTQRQKPSEKWVGGEEETSSLCRLSV
jgi:NADPH-dependent ferric siderophore reductase